MRAWRAHQQWIACCSDSYCLSILRLFCQQPDLISGEAALLWPWEFVSFVLNVILCSCEIISLGIWFGQQKGESVLLDLTLYIWVLSRAIQKCILLSPMKSDSEQKPHVKCKLCVVCQCDYFFLSSSTVSACSCSLITISEAFLNAITLLLLGNVICSVYSLLWVEMEMTSTVGIS